MDERRWARRLGWVSVGLGVAEIVASRAMMARLGPKGASVLRGVGLREIVSGLGLITRRARGPWLWARIASDAIDGAALGYTFATGRGAERKNAGIALAAVAPIAAMDLVCGMRLGLVRQ